MPVVDSHCHVSPVWYEPVESLLGQMDRNGVAQAVLTQLLGQYDNAYLEECRERYPGRFAIIVAVDAGRGDACDKLAALAARGAAGVRLRPDARSPGTDPLAIWRTAAAHRLAVSCVGTSEKFCGPEFAELLGSIPELCVVLEHLGGTSGPAAGDTAIRRRVFDIAANANVYLKLPGLGELVVRPAALPASGATLDARLAGLELALERLGPERLMWGSDFPVVSSREGYANALAWTRQALGPLAEGAQQQIFADTAKRVFKLPEL